MFDTQHALLSIFPIVLFVTVSRHAIHVDNIVELAGWPACSISPPGKGKEIGLPRGLIGSQRYIYVCSRISGPDFNDTRHY